jgi:hypothetical protein
MMCDVVRVQTDRIWLDSGQNHIRIHFNFSNTNSDSSGYEYESDNTRI